MVLRLQTVISALGCAVVAAAYCLASSVLQAQGLASDENGVPAGSLTTNAPVDAGRKLLADRGIFYGLNYIGQVQGNVAGGLRRGSIYAGRLEGILDANLEKSAGLKALSFHINIFNIHGNSLTPSYIGSLTSASFIEAKTTTRLSELWLEQKFFGGLVTVRAGQLAADVDFFTSGYGTQFINGTFGWPAVTGVNLPSGGAAYPFATPGVRVKIDPNANSSVLLAVFNGDPAGPGTNDPQIRNRYGLNFRLRDRPLAMAEGQLRANQDKDANGLAGSYKLGAFAHFGEFNDQRFGTDDLSLADPAGNGQVARRRGNTGIYAVIDQQLYRPKSGEPDKGVGVYLRAMANPSDRNLIDAYMDGGVVFAGLWAARPDDVLSFGAAYARVSSAARALDADAVRFNGSSLVRNAERLLEINYQAQIRSGWQMDLDLQRVFNPAGGGANPTDPSGTIRIPDATIITWHNSFKY